MGRIMAIDYGSKRTGFAVTDPTRTIATALTTIPTHTVLAFLAQYFSQEQVDLIVVGDPRRLNNQASDTTQLANQFVQLLAKKFPEKHIIRYDERFTSLMAGKSLIESGQSKKVRRDKSVLDQVSATILLQSYMESSTQANS